MQLVNLSRVTLNHRGISNMQFSHRYKDTKIHLQWHWHAGNCVEGGLPTCLQSRAGCHKINRCSTVASILKGSVKLCALPQVKRLKLQSKLRGREFC